MERGKKGDTLELAATMRVNTQAVLLRRLYTRFEWFNVTERNLLMTRLLIVEMF